MCRKTLVQHFHLVTIYDLTFHVELMLISGDAFWLCSDSWLFFVYVVSVADETKRNDFDL